MEALQSKKKEAVPLFSSERITTPLNRFSVSTLLLSALSPLRCDGKPEPLLTFNSFANLSVAGPQSLQSCWGCDASPPCPTPAGDGWTTKWAKPSFSTFCQNCNENPNRPTRDYDEGGGCFDETNKCYWVRQIDVACPTAGNPPIPWNCFEYQLQECQGQFCIDQDDDGYPKESPTCTIGPFDCDDTNPEINPDAVENCYKEGDEDCNGVANCEDPICYASGPTPACDEQCDADQDGFYKISCGGEDCDDDCSLCYPGFGGPNQSGEDWGGGTCQDGRDNDCDGTFDCGDSECQYHEWCQPEPPPPPPTPPPGGECPCNDCINGCDDEPPWCHYECVPNCAQVCIRDEYGEIIPDTCWEDCHDECFWYCD